jgi:hypothetical protein
MLALPKWAQELQQNRNKATQTKVSSSWAEQARAGREAARNGRKPSNKHIEQKGVSQGWLALFNLSLWGVTVLAACNNPSFQDPSLGVLDVVELWSGIGSVVKAATQTGQELSFRA